MKKWSGETIKWEIKVPLFRNIVLLKDFGIALGIPFGILIFILLVVSKGDISKDGMGYPLILIGAFFILSFIFIMLIYGGKYHAGFVIDSKGVLNYTQEKYRKRNKIINTMLIILGIFTKRLTATGIGLMAESKESMFLKWENIKKVKIYKDSKTIIIRGGFTEKIGLFCNDDNFDIVRDAILQNVEKDVE